MLRPVIWILALLVSGCGMLFPACPDGLPPQSAPMTYTVDGAEAQGWIGAEMKAGDKTILTLQMADGLRLELTLYGDVQAGANFGIDTSASYENERDAGAWLSGKNADGSLMGGGRGSIKITGRSATSISGEFDLIYFNANVPGVAIQAEFRDVPLAAC